MTIGMITSYPPAGLKYAEGERALSWYSANLMGELPAGDTSYVIYANRIAGEPATSAISSRVKIVRCWEPGLFAWLHILRKVKADRPDLVHVQHEIFQFGKGFAAFGPPLMILLFKILRIPTVVTLHSVPPLQKIDRSFMKAYRVNAPPILARILFWSTIWPIATLADRLVVHAEEFVDSLKGPYHVPRLQGRTTVIPLGVESVSRGLGAQEAKERLSVAGKSAILFFGNLTGYKGLEMLIDSMGLLKQDFPHLTLIVAGADTPGIQVAGDRPYSVILKERAERVGADIRFTGFVRESDVQLHFSAADLVVLPYTIALSSSGPFSLALAYERPFIASTALGGIVASEDVLFEPSAAALADKIRRFMTDPGFREQMKAHSERLRQERSLARVAEQTFALYRTFG
ncbi:MAG: glycosyltransferase [Acidobacteria bacterium]|nr:MAG: glycosyltransferase [Acidobacteriota bacterium]